MAEQRGLGVLGGYGSWPQGIGQIQVLKQGINGEISAIACSTVLTCSASTWLIWKKRQDLSTGRDLGGSDPQIEIDVRVHASQKLLQDQRSTVGCKNQLLVDVVRLEVPLHHPAVA